MKRFSFGPARYFKLMSAAITYVVFVLSDIICGVIKYSFVFLAEHNSSNGCGMALDGGVVSLPCGRRVTCKVHNHMFAFKTI